MTDKPYNIEKVSETYEISARVEYLIGVKTWHVDQNSAVMCVYDSQ